MHTNKFKNINIASGEVEDVFKNDPRRKILFVTKEEDGKMGTGAILTPDGEVREMRKSESNNQKDA